MTREEIEKIVCEIIAAVTGGEPDEIEAEHRLEEDLGVDSLDVVEIQLEIEDEFETDVSRDGWIRVSDIIDAVQARLTS
jgi:acyl carrier protein